MAAQPANSLRGKFFRSANRRQLKTFRLYEAPQPNFDGRIRNMPTIPRQQYIHGVNGSDSDMRGVAVGLGRKQPGLKNSLSE